MKTHLLLSLFLLPCAAMSWAQGMQYKPDFEVTLVGGYQFGGAMDETVKVEGVDMLGESIGLTGSEFAGVIVDYLIGPKLQLELSFDRQFTQLNLHAIDRSSVIKLSNLNLDVYHAGLMYNWSSGSVQPYIGGTLGLTSMIPTEGLSSVRRFSIAPVFGIKTLASKHFALRFQTRLLVTNMPKDRKYFYDAYQHKLNSYMTQLHFMLGFTVGL